MMTKPTKPAANKPAPVSHGDDESDPFLLSLGAYLTEEEIAEIKILQDQDLRLDLYYLKESETAAEFYKNLAKIITRSEYLTSDQRNDLAAMVKKPWTGRIGKKGRTPKESRHYAIYTKYLARKNNMNNVIPWSVAVEEIKNKYKMSSLDTAAKALRAAREFVEGKKPDPQGKK